VPSPGDSPSVRKTAGRHQDGADWISQVMAQHAEKHVSRMMYHLGVLGDRLCHRLIDGHHAGDRSSELVTSYFQRLV
jgi:hypothetical protein